MTASRPSGDTVAPATAGMRRLRTLRAEVGDLTARTVERGEELTVLVEELAPSHARDLLLASVLRLTEKAREEAAELRRASQ